MERSLEPKKIKAVTRMLVTLEMCSLFAPSVAWTVAPMTLTLKQASDLALTQSLDDKDSELNRQSAEIAVEQAKAGLNSRLSVATVGSTHEP